ncbi:MAG: Gfo/Idh/MocA family oxidoreductase [Anaerolineaceae bacterium]|nr:Gfo/Idh/MocA family oxidoreductase [Anaerolineaceae bacterium]
MGEEKYGVMIQGAAGGWGEMHLKAYLANPKVKVVGLCDVNEEAVKARVETFGLSCRIYTDFEKALADPDVDVVSIVTPSCYHVRDAVLAIQAGKHVLVEKPIATTLDDLALIKHAISETGVKTMAGFVLRWNGLFLTLKELMRDKAIGDVFMAQADYWQNVGWLDVSMNEWLGKKAIAGSTMLAAACHPYDAVRWLLGGPEAVEVFAYGTNFVYPDWDHNPTTLALIQMDNGAICKLVSTLEPCAPYLLRVELLGTEGTIRNNHLYIRRWQTQEQYIELPCEIPGLAALDDPMRLEIAHFINCIENDVESHANLADAIKTHEVLMAADLSVAQGKPVKLPLI